MINTCSTHLKHNNITEKLPTSCETSQSLISALIKVQKQIQNPLNTATNPFFKSRYAPLPEILPVVRELLSAENVHFMQCVESLESGAIGVKTIFTHISGENYTSPILSAIPEKKGVQAVGSTITYLRRYQLCALLGIASENDDDGETSMKHHPKHTHRKPSPKSITKTPPDKAYNEYDHILNDEIYPHIKKDKDKGIKLTPPIPKTYIK